MPAARLSLTVCLVVSCLVALAAGPAGAGPAVPAGPAGPAAALESSIGYQGYLTDGAGAPLQGAHSLVFQLWDDEAGGSQVGGDISPGPVTVTDGLVTVALPVDASSFDGRALWLRIGVDGVWLAPRQPLRPAPYALGLRPGARLAGDSSEPALGVTNAHMSGTAVLAHADAVGLDASGQTAVVATGRGVGIEARGMTGVLAEGDVGVSASGLVGVRGQSEIGRGVEGTSRDAEGVYGQSTGGPGVLGTSQMASGVLGTTSGGFASGVEGQGPTGVAGKGALVGVSGYTEADGSTGVLGTAKGNGSTGVAGTADGYASKGVHGQAQFGFGLHGEGEVGVQGQSTVGAGVVGQGVIGVQGSGSSTGVSGSSDAGVGVLATGGGAWATNAALRADSTHPTQGVAAYFTNKSGFANTHLHNTGTGEVLVLQSTGGRFLAAMDGGWDTKFRMEYNGNAYADGSWNAGGADYAELLAAVEGVRPGDVLVIGADGLLRPSSAPFAAAVAGVCSTRPGFVAGQPASGDTRGRVPLAVMGVVPVRASAENGAIQPGDLLVSAGTVGHAMRGGDGPPPGTVIGKALSGLAAGTGLVRLLATLQ